MKKCYIIIVIVVLFYGGLLKSQNSQINADLWNLPATNEISYSFEEYNGNSSILLSRNVFNLRRGDIAYLKEVDYKNAILEADICIPADKGYVGLAFRVQGRYKYECIYFRPQASGTISATQYMPITDSILNWWDYESEKYAAVAEIPKHKWFHVKLIYLNTKLKVYINHNSEPIMSYDYLANGTGSGSVGVFLGNSSKCYFSNIEVSPIDNSITDLSNINTSSIPYGSNKNNGKYAEINNLKLYYETYGSGTPLLLLHGGLGSINDFEKNIAELSKSYKVIAVDSRGHGRSSNPSDSLSYELMTDDMIDFLDYLNIDSINIVGYSDGGVIGLYMAAKYPSRVINVISSGANYLAEGLISNEFQEITMSVENVKTLQYWKKKREQYSKLNPNPDKFDSHIQLTRQMWQRSIYIPKHEFVNIKNRILLIYGDRDFVSLEHALEMFQLLPSKTTQLNIFPNTGHSVFTQKAKNANKLIFDFLN
jgi:pimeloyl-ACP methyl ester carboxylesterase